MADDTILDIMEDYIDGKCSKLEAARRLRKTGLDDDEVMDIIRSWEPPV